MIENVFGLGLSAVTSRPPETLPYLVISPTRSLQRYESLTLAQTQPLPFQTAMLSQYCNVVWLFSWTPKLKGNL
jgi:hypothetical protein